MKVLCHVGPWCRDYFEVIAGTAFPLANLRFVSGFRKLDETGLVQRYYELVASAKPDALVSEAKDEEILQRCRLLRSLDRDVAQVHIMAMRCAIREMLVRENPDTILCETIDQFLLDILFCEAEAMGIPAYGVVASFVNGYFRFSVRGELVKVRKPSDDEVKSVTSRLVDTNYLPGFVSKAKLSLGSAYLRNYFSNHARAVYFFLLRRLSGEPYNFHYWCSSRVIGSMHCHLFPALPLGDVRWKERIADAGKPAIFVPLQYFPEATVDYWSDCVELVSYSEVLCALLRRLSSEFTLVLKEHPNAWGVRQPSFYEKLKKPPGLIFCPTAIASQECVAATDAVLVWTGSVGFEAALRGKAVLTTCNPYYSTGKRFKRVSGATPLDEIRYFIAECRAAPIMQKEQEEMVRHLLSGLLPGRLQCDGSFSRSDPRDTDDAWNIGEWLRQLYEDRDRTYGIDSFSSSP